MPDSSAGGLHMRAMKAFIFQHLTRKPSNSFVLLPDVSIWQAKMHQILLSFATSGHLKCRTPMPEAFSHESYEKLHVCNMPHAFHQILLSWATSGHLKCRTPVPEAFTWELWKASCLQHATRIPSNSFVLSHKWPFEMPDSNAGCFPR